MSIPGAASPLFLSAAAGAEAAAYQIDRSLRFNSADSSHLTFQPSSAGNRKTWTWSCWLKAPEIVNEFKAIFSAYGGSGNAYFMLDLRDNNPRLISWSGSAINWEVKASAVLRDPSAWYHLVWVVDTTQSTASDRVKLYINGSQQTDFATANYPSQNYDTYVNNTAIHKIGEIGASAYSGFLDGYLADVHFIDGQALAPTDFGEYDSSNVWQPKQFAGTYGTNGFRLDFSDNSSDQALGYDAAVTQPTLNPRGGMDVITYTGNGSTQTLGGLAFQPDFLWIKARNAAYDHYLQDSVRGVTKTLESNNTDVETTNADGVTSFNPDGFSVGAGSGYTAANVSGTNYVAWAWKAGGPAELNEDGSIDSQVSVSTDYGFSIAKYTGTSSAASVGHGLNSAPKLIIVKGIGHTDHWHVYHQDVHPKYLRLSTEDSEITNTNVFASAPSSTVFNIGTDSGVNYSAKDYIAYCWSEVSGFSKFGSYTGNASTNGPTITTNFKPRFILVKNIDTAARWIIWDTERDGGTLDKGLSPNNANAEITAFNAQVLSNGFQITDVEDTLNKSGDTFIYAAFADRPGNNWTPNNLIAEPQLDVSQGMDVVTYTGTGSTQSITGLDFQPDLVWIKQRNTTRNHQIVDSVRGATKDLRSNTATDEGTTSTGLTAFTSDGFTLGGDAGYNQSSGTYVAWCWNAGANSDKTYTVKVVSDSGNKYRFDDFGTSAVTLDLQEGSTYVFDQSDSSNAGHPIRFGTSANGTDYTTGVTHTGTPGSAGAKTTLVLGTGVATLYYSCANHSGMGGQINTNSTAGASNFNGSIQATTKASTTYGFSAVSYTGNNSTSTVGHGLNAVPRWVIVKSRSADSPTGWMVKHSSLQSNYNLALNLTDTAWNPATNGWVGDLTSSTTFSLVNGSSNGNNVNQSNVTYIAYCWSEVPGFSKFDSYSGGTNPKTITTGFKPKFVIIKRTDTANYWIMIDSVRGGTLKLAANDSGEENKLSTIGDTSQNVVQFLDDGFKLTTTNAGTNTSGGTYIYMAFADKPPGEIIDSLIDTPTDYEASSGNNGGNYATLNPLSSASSTLSNGNLDFSNSNSSNKGGYGTIGMQSEKYYFEATMPSSGTNCQVGIVTHDGISASNYVGSNAYGWAYDANGTKYNNGSNSSYGATYTNNDVIGVAFDAGNGTLTFYKNGVSQGTAFTGLTSGPYFPAVSTYNSGLVVNFGARPFAYTPPTGFVSLCTQNLTDPTIADGSTAMDVLTWSGSSGNRSFSSLSLSPDLVWIKQRNQSYSVGHQIYDIVRGAGSLKQLDSSDTTAEGGGNTDDYGYLSSFDSAGFSVTSGSIGDDYVNKSGVTYVSWAWDAGTSTATNTDGSITSNVRANQSAGFSIVSYTGDGSGTDTIGHGLNDAPSLVITKSRGTTGSWRVFTDVGGTWKLGNLNNTDAFVNATVSAPTSSVFSIDGNSNASTTHIAYCFAPVASYSAFGDFINPSSTDGAFVYCGFKPAFILAKCAENISSSSGLGHWILKDTTRSPYNDPSDGNTLVANVDAAEDDFFNANQAAVDILSNGFKIRHPNSAPLGDTGRRYIFAAFASHPFKTARAR